MLQKLAPLIVLALFAVGVYFMMQGMDKAVHHTKVKLEQPKK
jgi:uncharacterized protein (UPF0333 family)